MMNLDTFLASTQSDLVTWLTGLANTHRSRELDIKSEDAISYDELLFAVATFKGLQKDGIVLETDAIDDFMLSVDAELIRRSNAEA